MSSVVTVGLSKTLPNSPPLPYRLGPELLESKGGFVVRIAENARRSVVFFGIPEPPLGEIGYGGTGFLLAYEIDGAFFPYIITNRHVAKRLESEPEFTLRANLKSGGSDPMPIEDCAWVYHPDPDVDLAASVIYLNKRVYDHGFFGGQMHKADQVLCGEAVRIVGLFRLREGKAKNVPVVHTGHIATLPDPSERIPIKVPLTGAIRSLEDVWLSAFQSALTELSSEFAIPSTVYITADPDLLEWFVSLATKEQFAQFTMTDEPFSIIPLDMPFLHEFSSFGLHAKRDTFLTIGTIFADKVFGLS